MRTSWGRDLLVALVVAGVSALAAARVDLHERLFAYSRRWESLQLDELPVALFVFAICLMALYARRVVQLRGLLVENRRLSQQAIDIQESERKHLARELHDELGQYLNAVMIDARTLTADPVGSSAAAAQRISGNVEHVYGVVRGLISRLRPAALDDLGLAAALQAGVDRWRESQPDIRFVLKTSGEVDSLGERLNLALYRIVQEGLTNSVRHARAGQIQVELQGPQPGGEPWVVLRVSDDGIGLTEPGRHETRFGLRGIRERVELLGGQFDIATPKGGGVCLSVKLPLKGDVA